jgi:hypothetical protein
VLHDMTMTIMVKIRINCVNKIHKSTKSFKSLNCSMTITV